MTRAQIIAALGGPFQVGRDLGAKPNTVVFWSRPGRSIPAKWWRRITQLPLAVEKSITLSTLAEAHASEECASDGKMSPSAPVSQASENTHTEAAA